jgi:hypothetical protein
VRSWRSTTRRARGRIQIGAPIRDVLDAFPLHDCSIELGEDTVVDCQAGGATFTWLVNDVPGLDNAEVTTAQAAAIVGRRRLRYVAG